MYFPRKGLGLYTDFYEICMAQGYFFCEKKNEQACFDYYFRTNPYQGGFTVFAGLQDFLELLDNFKYGEDEISYLKAQGFKPEFLEYLKDFAFTGNIYSVKEGEIVFPNEPLLKVQGNLIECQLIESLLLNILNFESLIATKAFRIKLSCKNKTFSDFGLRRAQGLGSLHASRAAIIGGASSTSNVLAGKHFNIPVSGTQAHSWIQSFHSEQEAFENYVKFNPNNAILLVDTYDTLKSGVPNAIETAKKLEQNGNKLYGIRLDSGDLAYFSKKARKMLDDAGLNYIKIIASNQLNEYVIKSLINDQNAPIDAFGVGTDLITGKQDAALDGVYKLTEINGEQKMKFSENIEKVTLPGDKKLFRLFDSGGKFYRDAILLNSEKIKKTEKIFHPVYDERNTTIKNLVAEELQEKVVANGKIISPLKTPAEINKYLENRILHLADEHKRFISPHIYKVGISEKLLRSRNILAQKLKTNIELK